MQRNNLTLRRPRLGAASGLLVFIAGLVTVMVACGGSDDAGTGPLSTEVPAESTTPGTTSADSAQATSTTDAPEATTLAESDGAVPVDVGSLPVGRLSFDSDRSGNLDIWVLEAGASDPVQITTDEKSDRVSSWSPDASKLLFTSDRDYVLGLDSPTGLRSYALFVISSDGSGEAQVLGNRSFNTSPSFSPDSSQIAFESDISGTFQVYVMAADGSSSPTVLTDDPVQASGPAWSPDGTRLLFSSLRDGNREIYVMDADGGRVGRLTENDADDGAAVWSPDGTRIAFQSDRDGERHVYVMNADGTGVTQLTDDPGRDGFPSWSPDGTMIAFDSTRTGDLDIYVMNADGSGQINITNHPARDAFPSWHG